MNSTAATGRLMQALAATKASTSTFDSLYSLAAAYYKSSKENDHDGNSNRSPFGSTSTPSTLELLGLIPSDYDGGYLLADNGSVFMNDYDASITSNENETTAFTANQYSAPFIYIAFMLVIYVLISLVVFLSALYSHRKHVGYNYDDSLNQDSCSSSDEQQQQQQHQQQQHSLERHIIFMNQNERTGDKVKEEEEEEAEKQQIESKLHNTESSLNKFSASHNATSPCIKKQKKRTTRLRHRHTLEPAIHRRCGALKRKLNMTMLNAKVRRNQCLPSSSSLSSSLPRVDPLNRCQCSFMIEKHLHSNDKEYLTADKRSLLAKIYNLVNKRSSSSKYAKLKTKDENGLDDDNEI
jgi:hypothetical protein